MKYIPFYIPHIPKTTYKEIKKVIDSGWITTGPKVKAFEDQFGQVIKSEYNIAVSSCTAALHLAYLAHHLGPGDEVIVPSFTFCSTVNMIVQVGATPIFCDIDENIFCANPESIQKLITARTKAIVVVHYAGMPANLEEINRLAKNHGLIVIEDAAHAFMTKYHGQYIGSGNNTTCFSFYATKNLTTAEGGMVTTSDLKIKEFIEIMRMHGISKHAWNRYGKQGSWEYDVISPGYKYNLTDIAAVIGIEQLKRIKVSASRRHYLASTYKKFLEVNPNVILPAAVPDSDSEHAWHLFTIRISPGSKITRDDLIDKLNNFGIGTSVHFIPNHLQSYYQKRFGKNNSLPVTEKVYQSIVSLPFYEDLTKKQIEYICSKINILTNIHD